MVRSDNGVVHLVARSETRADFGRAYCSMLFTLIPASIWTHALVTNVKTHATCIACVGSKRT